MKIVSLLCATGLAAALPMARAHDHIAAAVTDTNGNLQPDIGEPLRFVSTSISGTTNSYTYHMVPKAVGQNYGGYYSLDEFPRALYADDYFTFIAWSDGQTQGDGPVGTAYHAPTGAEIWVEIVSVTGPVGGHFGFWESNASSFQTTPTQSFAVGNPTNGYKFRLSEVDTEVPPVERDPYGHVHNRGWTVDVPGDYEVTFRLRDMSGLGAGGGPLSPNSPDYTFHFTTTLDLTPPQITNVPANITVATANPAGVIVNYTMPTASDNVGVVSFVASKASGTTFPVGVTTVTFTARDAAGNQATASFAGTVQLDQTPPQITNVPANQTVVATSLSGAGANYTMPTASDNVGVVSFVASHASGTTFPAGVTTVTFTALDAAGNQATASFTVTVLTAVQAWRQTYFGTTANSGDAADLFDFDRDGLVNLIEFALGLNPLLGSSNQVPGGSFVGSSYVVSFAQPAGFTGVTYGAEWSGTLAPLDWHAIPDTGVSPQHTFSVPLAGNTEIFIRLKVSIP